MIELLKVEEVDAGYGEIQVLWKVSISVNKGEIVSIDRKEYLKAKTRIMSRVEEVFEI